MTTAFSSLETLLPGLLPTGVVGTILAALIVGVTLWRKNRSGQITDWSKLLEESEQLVARQRSEVDRANAERDRAITLADERRRREERQYDRAERYRRALVKADVEVPTDD